MPMNRWKLPSVLPIAFAVIAAVLLFACAGVYLNWSYQQKNVPEDLTASLPADSLMNDETYLVSAAEEDGAQAVSGTEDYFAQVRLSRQQSLDSAVDLLEETIAYDEGTEIGNAAVATLNEIVSNALSEAQIESLVIAKGYSDCVTYITDGVICVAVSAPAEGLSREDVALISDVVTSQTDCELSQLRIIEVGS